jgi:diguanylate cyclase (GGDEF)-like protein/PAS domain S-box-containing protein
LLPSFYVAIAALITGGFVLVGLSVFTWLRRPAIAGSAALPLVLAGSAVWVLAAAAEHIAPTLAGKIIASKIQYLGVVTVPPASVCTILTYLGLQRWLRRFLYLAIPVAILSITIVFSNEYHHWHWSEIALDPHVAFDLVKMSHGPSFWVINMVNHSQILMAAALLLPSSLKSWQIESTLVYLGLAAPWIANLLYISGNSPVANLDITPFGLIITGIFFAISFQGIGSIFSTIKLANRHIVESIADLILVVDQRQQLLSANKSARAILANHPLPAPIEVMFGKHNTLLDYLQAPSSAPEQDIEIEVKGEAMTFNIRSFHTGSHRGRNKATVYVLRDATAQRAYENDMKRHRKQLRQVIDLIPHPIYARDASGRFLLANDSAAIRYGLEGESVEGFTLEDLHADPNEASLIRESDQQVIESQKSLTTEQLFTGLDGRALIYQTTKMPFSHDENKAPGIVAMSIDVTKERERERLLERMASTDPLTNLPNRRRFQQVLDKAISRANKTFHRIALLSLDLDRFKMINDNYGHPVGDEVLCQAAERLRRNIRFSDRLTNSPEDPDQITVSRLGGDEFMVLLPNISGSADAAIVARRLIKALEEPFFVKSDQLQLGSSVGIAIYPEDGADPETLVRHCDRALTSVKGNIRGRFEFYNTDLGKAEQRRHTLEQALRRALDRDEFKMHYQPIWDAKTNQLHGAEALLRWDSAELGTVSPDEFIPVAEESGLVIRIGEVVLRSVCEQIAMWKKRGFELPVIAINLSARQLIDINLRDQVEGVFRDTGVSGAEIEFELTEGSILSENPRVEETLNWLQAQGSTLALDDFGTGYSSLSHLRRLSFQKLKIDRSFVSGLGSSTEDEQLVRGVIALAQRLDIQTVAEGVETEQQLDILRGEGCDYIQGYLLGRPEPPESLERLFNKEV